MNDSTSPDSATSMLAPNTCAPSAWSSATGLSRSAADRPQIATEQPSSAIRAAIARPIPRVPLVTTATLPANFKSTSLGFLSLPRRLQGGELLAEALDDGPRLMRRECPPQIT